MSGSVMCPGLCRYTDVMSGRRIQGIRLVVYLCPLTRGGALTRLHMQASHIQATSKRKENGAMEYPKHVVKIGERDENVVKAVKRALNKALALNEGDDLYLDPDNPRFGPKMKKIVKLFQLRNVD